MKSWLLLGVSLLLLLTGCPAEQATGPQALRVAMDPQIGLPFIEKKLEKQLAKPAADSAEASKPPKTQYQGFEVDIANYLATKLQRPLEIVETRWPELPRQVLRKKADLALNALEKPLGEQPAPEGLSFTEHYYTAYQQLTVGQKDNFTYNLSDLKGKPVAVIENSVGAIFLEELNKLKKTNIAIKTFKTPAEAFASLAKGQVKAVLSERAVASWFAWNNKNIKLAGEPISQEIPYVGLVQQENSELLSAINSALRAAHKDPKFRAIFDKWHVSIKR